MTSSRVVRRPVHSEQRVQLGAHVELAREIVRDAATHPGGRPSEPPRADHDECTRRIAVLEAALRELRNERDQLHARLQSQNEQLTDLQRDADRRGYETGLQRGHSETERARTELTREWRGVMEQCAAQYEARTSTFQTQLHEVVSVSVAKLLGDHALNTASVRTAIEQTLRESGISGPAKILIAPLQYEQLMRQGSTHVAALRERKLEVAPDARVTTGGCIVETPTGLVDGRFEVQLAALRALIAGNRQGAQS